MRKLEFGFVMMFFGIFVCNIQAFGEGLIVGTLDNSPFMVEFVSSEAWKVEVDNGSDKGFFSIKTRVSATDDCFISINTDPDYVSNLYLQIGDDGHVPNPVLAITPLGPARPGDNQKWAKMRDGESRTFLYKALVDNPPITEVYRFFLFEVGWAWDSAGEYGLSHNLPESFSTPGILLYQVPEPSVVKFLGVSLLLLLVLGILIPALCGDRRG